MEAYYSHIADFILHFDRYLPVVMEAYGHWIYAFLFIIVFCETGLVVTPFLPGDSLLFACGALAATADGLSLPLLAVIFLVAAISGDASNYEIGKHFGHRMLEAHSRFIKPEYVKKQKNFMQNTVTKLSFSTLCTDCTHLCAVCSRHRQHALPHLCHL